MSILAIIPARSGSTRIVDKNKKKLGGKTLVEWAAYAARNSGCSRIVVSTDDRTLACGEECIIRPTAISGPSADISQALQYTLQECEKDGSSYEWIITLQPTIPCRPHGMIDQMLSAINKENAKAAVTTVPTVPWMWRCFKDNSAANEWHPGPYPRSQDFEKTGRWLAELNCITITHHSVIREGMRWQPPLLLCALPSWATVDIDDEDDLVDAIQRWPELERWMSKPVTYLSYNKIETIRRL